MCGIAGFWETRTSYNSEDILVKMGAAILRRGPDASGVWSDHNVGINFVHRRLSIIDLSISGHQPMCSHSGRYILIFNGEIYNYKQLKSELELHQTINWLSHSDTEVLLCAFDIWGIEKTIEKCEGMFAIALWDKEAETLFLIRDRAGEKPLYYGYSENLFLFASELKAIEQHPKFKRQIEPNSIEQLMLHNCIPAPLSIYKNIKKLLPGHYLKLSLKDYHQKNMPLCINYWNLTNNRKNVYQGSLSEAALDLERLLKYSIGQQMEADVPVGCFLSGGVDSSTISAIMQSLSISKINTFSVGFHDKHFDEAKYAEKIANYIGTNHTDLYIDGKDALDIIPQLSDIYNEPFADSSQIPSFIVSKLAKTKVKVVLSGDAGDELFAGYSRYMIAENLWAKINKVPYPLRRLLVGVISVLNPNFLNYSNKLIKLPIKNFSNKKNKLINLLKTNNFEQFYINLISHMVNGESPLVGNVPINSIWLQEYKHMDLISRMQAIDFSGYLPDDILAKVDRASMHNSLETRIPFLNHKIIEFASSLPLDYKVNSGKTKVILHEVLNKYVPSHFFERPKSGFAAPICNWLRNELKDWAIDLLNANSLNAQGYFNSATIINILNKHISGKEDHSSLLWNILMFQQWFINKI